MTRMRDETLECAQVARRFLNEAADRVLAEGERTLGAGIEQVEVLGRGSSSHAGTLLRYALAAFTPLAVSAAMPSTSVSATSRVSGAASRHMLVAISQSGRSPDLLAYARARRTQGARVLALVNSAQTPLGEIADVEALLGAGLEQSVAATKSTVASCLAGLTLVAGRRRAQGNSDLWQALQGMPEQLETSQALDWRALTEILPGARAVFVVGRGPTFGIAKEVALKICEATATPALAFSSAEFIHGPLGAVSADTPVLGLSADSAHDESVGQALARAREKAAPTLGAFSSRVADLPVARAREAFTDAVAMLVPAYLAIEAAARSMGLDPDRPAGLTKVTRTL